jgi:hypothetical protein
VHWNNGLMPGMFGSGALFEQKEQAEALPDVDRLV